LGQKNRQEKKSHFHFTAKIFSILLNYSANRKTRLFFQSGFQIQVNEFMADVAPDFNEEHVKMWIGMNKRGRDY
jgi:hypothetical protein